MPLLLCSAYLPPVSFFMAMKGHGQVLVEQFDSYHKQTYRNRCVIATSNGPQSLTIPVVHGNTPRQFMRDIRISSHGNWRHLHWNAFSSAYMNSPFFMYYEDDIRPVFEGNHSFLVDFNAELLDIVLKLVGINAEVTFTDGYVTEGSVPHYDDFRHLVDPGVTGDMEFKPYYQVFSERTGFIPNLSIADMLFNLGPETPLYL